MGQLLSTTFYLAIDWGLASITAGVYEHVFPTFTANTKGRAFTLLEALSQLTMEIATISYLSPKLTITGLESGLDWGLTILIFFSLLYSPNMMAKFRSFHNNLMNVLLLVPGGYIKTPSRKVPTVSTQVMNQKKTEEAMKAPQAN